MKVIDIPQNSQEWLELRKSKITGSKLGDIYAPRGGRKIGFYQLIADRLAIVEETDEAAHDRGHRLEDEALETASAELGIELKGDCGMWISDEDENIAISPDGSNKARTVAGEVKCLGAARHLQAVIENKVPDNGYRLQAIQYFVVNPKLKQLHFIFYNPNVSSRPLHIITMERADLKDDIKFWDDYEKQVLEEVNQYVEELAF